jgi:serine/threonine protein kinase
VPDADRSKLGAGDRVGKWEIEQALSPSSPTTYLAHHVEDSAKKALIKVLPKGADAMARAKREVRILKALDHAAIPQFVDFGFSQTDNAVWLATEYFPGSTLAEIVREEPPDWQQTCRLFHQIAGALAEVHSNGFVHQAVSADNVVVSRDGRVQFADFETAEEASELERASAPVHLGPLAYAAPELAKQSRSPRTDLYALGVMLHETLTRRGAFPLMVTADRNAALRFLDYKRKEAPPLDPGADHPTWLRNIVRKATEPDPDRRLPDAETFVMFLDAAQTAWDAAPPATQTPAPANRQSTSTEPPPMIMMVRPSIAGPAVPVLVAANSPALDAPETPMVPLAYASAAVGGFVTGIAAGLLLIGAIDTSYVNIH